MSVVYSLVMLTTMLAPIVSLQESDASFLFTSDVPLSDHPSAQSCLQGIPRRYRAECRDTALSTYRNTLLVGKRQCCSRWRQLACLRRYIFNSIYCNQHQQDSMKRYLDRLADVTLHNPLGQCVNYPPIEAEKHRLKPHLGQVARCQPQGIL